MMLFLILCFIVISSSKLISTRTQSNWAPWMPLITSPFNSVSLTNPLYNGVSSTGGQVAPSCFADDDGKIYLRGQLTVNASYGKVQAIALLPKDSLRNCACTPPSTQDVIVTTSAVGGCTVRLIISAWTVGDNDHDGMVAGTDMTNVAISPFFSSDPTNPVPCTLNQDGTTSLTPTGYCGSVDCNQDGQVDNSDVTCVQNSCLNYPVPCGAVNIVTHNCSSMISVSLDSIVYFNDVGTVGATTAYFKKRALKK